MEGFVFNEFPSGFALLDELDDFGPAVFIKVQAGEPLSSHTCERFAEWLLMASGNLRSLRRDPSTPVVYAITDGRFHKVGKAVLLRNRIKQLQTGNGNELKTVCFIRSHDEREAYEIENAVHRSLRDYRMAGEWFSCCSHTVYDSIYQAARSLGVRRLPVDVCVGHDDLREAT